MGERLDEAKLELLRSWGEGLSGDDRAELKSAGKAILLLVEEIERLHVDLWSAHTAAPAADDLSGAAEAPVAPAPELGSALGRRLRGVRGRLRH